MPVEPPCSLMVGQIDGNPQTQIVIIQYGNSGITDIPFRKCLN